METQEPEQTVKQRVIQNTWWIDSKNRTWLIHSVWSNGNEPTTVWLLQLGKSEHEEQPYELIQDYIHKRIFKQIT